MDIKVMFLVLLVASIGESVDLSIFIDHSDREMMSRDLGGPSDAVSKLEKYQSSRPEEEPVYRAHPPGRPHVPVSTAWSSGPIQPAFRGKLYTQELPRIRRPAFSELRIRPIRRKQKVHVPPEPIPATELALERTPKEVIINDIHLVDEQYLPETEEVAKARQEHLKTFEAVKERNSHPVV